MMYRVKVYPLYFKIPPFVVVFPNEFTSFDYDDVTKTKSYNSNRPKLFVTNVEEIERNGIKG